MPEQYVPSQGVNTELGDDASRLLYEAATQSWDNRPGAVVELHSSFSGLRALRPDYKPLDCFESMGSDGIGTKVEVAERLQDHSTIAFDLFAMACDDAAIRGAEPIAINTVLDVNNLQEEDVLTQQAIREIAAGYVAAAKAAGVVILGGEMAEIGERVNGYGRFNYNWCGTVLWYAQQDRMLTGHDIRPGDTLIGLAEHGLRSNGYTDLRIGMHDSHGPEWHDVVVKELGETSLGRLAQKPSIIYSSFITKLTGGYDINREPLAKLSGAANITGGGQPSKLGRMLEPSGYGAVINRPIDPPPIMLEAQKARGFSDAKAYGTWNMGPGMVLATPEPEAVFAAGESEEGIDLYEIGHTIEDPRIHIKNRGALQEQEWLTFS